MCGPGVRWRSAGCATARGERWATYPRPSGTFRFVAPATSPVFVQKYGGDTVTEKSQARARVERISTSSSS